MSIDSLIKAAVLISGTISLSSFAGPATPGTCHHHADGFYHCNSSDNDGGTGGGGNGGNNGSGGGNHSGGQNDDPPPPSGGGNTGGTGSAGGTGGANNAAEVLSEKRAACVREVDNVHSHCLAAGASAGLITAGWCTTLTYKPAKLACATASGLAVVGTTLYCDLLKSESNYQCAILK